MKRNRYNLIIIDLDGCFLSTIPTVFQGRFGKLDLNTITYLNYLCKEVDNAVLVLSSTLRADSFNEIKNLFNEATADLKKLNPTFENHLRFCNFDEQSWRIPIEEHAYGWITALLQKRGPQTETYLKNYGDSISDYIMIDDDPAEFDDLTPHQIKRFVQIEDPRIGFSMTELNRCLTLFGKNTIECA